MEARKRISTSQKLIHEIREAEEARAGSYDSLFNLLKKLRLKL
jgi:hypothetical protein